MPEDAFFLEQETSQVNSRQVNTALIMETVKKISERLWVWVMKPQYLKIDLDPEVMNRHLSHFVLLFPN